MQRCQAEGCAGRFEDTMADSGPEVPSAWCDDEVDPHQHRWVSEPAPGRWVLVEAGARGGSQVPPHEETPPATDTVAPADEGP